ncbi:hypothetical protein CDD81_6458 [Ophiocordyceps australis]|uniref:Uncharacterized protein n=1 Tax=Ophiocordyceps australis TaxID=1399860 RepID=A0A2C5YI85_9HYPO|nr:hypothetical protein CDD81_6458 [Ophiocordyceps australis]
MKPVHLASLALQFPTTIAHVFFSTGSTVSLNDVPYYVPPDAVANVSAISKNLTQNGDLVPVTFLSSNAASLSLRDLQERLLLFSQADDVFQQGFTQVVYLQHQGAINAASFGNVTVISSPNTNIANGPYFASAKGLVHKAYRLYADVQGAFTETSVPRADGSHTVLPANVPGQSLAIAVPSRLYYSKTPQQPLAGVRLGVKDIFDVRGLRTSNGNRAWYHLYPPAEHTAIAVQNLVDAGAVIVGKMKTSQFANGETATADWVEYHAPFNPRGDGYQDPSSSSAGPAAGEAAYPWLDIALGSDTGGSIRTPSQLQGLYGNRPSHGLVSLSGTMPLSPQFDTAGLLARDPRLWRAAARMLYGHSMPTASNTSFPSNLLTVGFPTEAESDHDVILLQFLSRLQSFLGAKVVPWNIAQSWWLSNPDSPELQLFVNNTYEVLSAQDQAHLVRDGFLAAYAASHAGRQPHINPAPVQRWALADSTGRTASTSAKATASKKRFAAWFNSSVLSSCSDRLVVYVPRIPKSVYRGAYRRGPSLPQPFGMSRVSVLSGAPEVAVPIGEVMRI